MLNFQFKVAQYSNETMQRIYKLLLQYFLYLMFSLCIVKIKLILIWSLSKNATKELASIL